MTPVALHVGPVGPKTMAKKNTKINVFSMCETHKYGGFEMVLNKVAQPVEIVRFFIAVESGDA